jgi:hypothetical protein
MGKAKPVRLFFCSLCGRRFKHRWQKREHLKHVHGIGRLQLRDARRDGRHRHTR